MKTALIPCFGLLLCAANPALAQDESDAPGALDVNASVSVVSDYHFRGLTLSDGDPAVQASLEAEHESGLYAGVWGSSIAKYAGTRVETDVYAGWRGAAAGLDLDLGAQAYLYPGGHGANYVELIGSASKTLGPVELTAGAAWSPSQKAIGSTDNLYLFGALRSGIPGTPVTAIAEWGYEDGGLAGPDGTKWNWSLGAELVVNRLSFGVAWHDTDIHRPLDPDGLAKGRVVASATFSF